MTGGSGAGPARKVEVEGGGKRAGVRRQGWRGTKVEGLDARGQRRGETDKGKRAGIGGEEGRGASRERAEKGRDRKGGEGVGGEGC